RLRDSELRSETRDPRPWTLDPGPGTLTRGRNSSSGKMWCLRAAVGLLVTLLTILGRTLTPETSSIYSAGTRTKEEEEQSRCATLSRTAVLSMRFSGPHFYLNVTLPTGPGDTPLLELLNQSRFMTIEPVVIYTLNITYPSWAAQVYKRQTGLYNLQLKNNNTNLLVVLVILSSVFVYLYTHPRKKPHLPLSLLFFMF
ncbi:hypothetical protein CRUP_038498, partial [Coryphaenoides rupestris]